MEIKLEYTTESLLGLYYIACLIQSTVSDSWSFGFSINAPVILYAVGPESMSYQDLKAKIPNPETFRK